MKKDKDDYVDLSSKEEAKSGSKPADGKGVDESKSEIPKPPYKKKTQENNEIKPPLPPKPAVKKAGEKAEKKPAGKEDVNKPIAKKYTVRDHLETDVDKLYELARARGIIKVRDAAKALNIDVDQVEEWGRILEEHKLIRLRYPPVGEPVLILKRFTTDTEKLKAIKEHKKLKPRKRVFIINLIILLCFAAIVSFYTIRFGAIRITYIQAYLAAAVIIIIALALIFKFKIKKRFAKNGKKNIEKPESEDGKQKPDKSE